MSGARRDERPSVTELWKKWRALESEAMSSVDPDVRIYNEQQQIECDMILTQSTRLEDIRCKVALLRDYMQTGSPGEGKEHLLLTSIDCDLYGLR